VSKCRVLRKQRLHSEYGLLARVVRLAPAESYKREKGFAEDVRVKLINLCFLKQCIRSCKADVHKSERASRLAVAGGRQLGDEANLHSHIPNSRSMVSVGASVETLLPRALAPPGPGSRAHFYAPDHPSCSRAPGGARWMAGLTPRGTVVGVGGILVGRWQGWETHSRVVGAVRVQVARPRRGS
jgi:hypothetical protein